MYAPHTVSLINQHGDELHLTVLRGVMVQDLERRAVLQAGAYDARYTKIFIPFGVDARNADGERDGAAFSYEEKSPRLSVWPRRGKPMTT